MYATLDTIVTARTVEVPSLHALVTVTAGSLPALRALLAAGIAVRVTSTRAAARV